MLNSSNISLLRKDKPVSAIATTVTSAPRAVLTDHGVVIKDQLQMYTHSNASLSSCYSCASTETISPRPQAISYHDILSVKYVQEPSPFNDQDSLVAQQTTNSDTEVINIESESELNTLVEISYVRKRKENLIPETIRLQIDPQATGDIVEEIYKNAYKHSKPKQSILVLVNPRGGQGKALKLFLSKVKPIFDAADCEVEIRETKYNKHAIDIMEHLDIANYDIIACASGDGIPYEVINGLYKREDRAEAFNKLSISQIPCGSGNAMSESCHWTGNASVAALSTIKAASTNIDLMAVTQLGDVTVSFLSQTIGIIADSDIDTEHLRFLGAIRFDLGVCYKVFSKAKYPCDIYIKYAAKSKDELRTHYDSHSNSQSLSTRSTADRGEIKESNFHLKYNANEAVPSDWEQVDPEFADNISIFYTGKMPYISKDVNFFPAALPSDGTIDLIMLDGRTPITRQAPILLSLDKGTHVQAPEIRHSKILAYRLVPKGVKNRCLSIDGERYDYDEFQVEVLPNCAKFLLREGNFVETNF